MKKFIITICFALLLLTSCDKVTDYVDRWDVTKTEFNYRVTEYNEGEFYWLIYEDVIVLHRDDTIPEEIAWLKGSPWPYTMDGSTMTIWRNPYAVERNGDTMTLEDTRSHLKIYLTRH